MSGEAVAVMAGGTRAGLRFRALNGSFNITMLALQPPTDGGQHAAYDR
jgi:hypothetical protein